MTSATHRRRVPLWMILLILAVALPVLFFPSLLALIPSQAREGTRVMVWIYPFYIIGAAWLAWQCYGRRTVLTWILLALMILTHFAIRQLVEMSPV